MCSCAVYVDYYWFVITLTNTFEGKVLAKKHSGRQKTTFLKDVKEEMGLMSYGDLKWKVMDRDTVNSMMRF